MPGSGTRLNRRLVLESLEDRVVPAGNVTAAVVGNVLQISGDNEGDAFETTRDGAGHYVITGQAGTTVNGLASDTLGTGSLLALHIRTGSGADSVTVGGAAPDLPGVEALDISIDTGSGADSVVVQNTTARGDLTIRTGGAFSSQAVVSTSGVGHAPDAG